jgi:hypothetical protein
MQFANNEASFSNACAVRGLFLPNSVDENLKCDQNVTRGAIAEFFWRT